MPLRPFKSKQRKEVWPNVCLRMVSAVKFVKWGCFVVNPNVCLWTWCWFQCKRIHKNGFRYSGHTLSCAKVITLIFIKFYPVLRRNVSWSKKVKLKLCFLLFSYLNRSQQDSNWDRRIWSGKPQDFQHGTILVHCGSLNRFASLILEGQIEYLISSVTRLGDFRKFLMTNFLANVAQILDDFLVIL